MNENDAKPPNEIQFSDFPNICRFCLKANIVAPIFKQSAHNNATDPNAYTDLPDLIFTLTSLQVKPDDGLPMFLCKLCFDKLFDCQLFRQQCLQSTKHLEKIKFDHNEKIKHETDETDDFFDNNDDNAAANDSNDDNNEQIYDDAGIKSETFDIPAATAGEKKQIAERKKRTKETKPRRKYTKRGDKDIKPKGKEKIKKEKKPLERHICQMCGIIVVNLDSHIQSAHMEKVYNHECDICGKKFHHYTRIKEHIRMVHVNERKYKCSICPNAFNCKKTLVKHIRTHTGEKNFHCDLCNRAFGARSAMKKHRLLHTQERKFACEYCDKRFAQRNGLQNHVVIHTGDRPFKCGLCPMTFKFSSTASQHRKAHLNRQPYQCVPCGMDFNSIQLYRTHMKIHPENEGIPNIETMFQNNYNY